MVVRRRCCPGAAAGGGMCLVFPWWYDVVFPIRRGAGGGMVERACRGGIYIPLSILSILSLPITGN